MDKQNISRAFRKIPPLVWIIIILLVLMVLTVGRLEKREKAEGDITLYTWVPVDEERVNSELLDEFESANPGAKVFYVNIPDANAMQKLQVMYAAGTPPDVISLHGAYFLPFASKGMLLPLDDMVRKSDVLNTGDFYPKLVDACMYGGKLYSLPRYTSVYILFYNRDMFDSAGISYPGNTWTWDTFLEAAKRLTGDSDNNGVIDTFGCAVDFWGGRIYPWLWQNGNDIYSSSEKECYLAEESAVEAIQFLVDLKYRHNVTPLSLPAEYKSNVELFRVGRVGMYLSGAWEIQNMQTGGKFRWDIAPLPKGRKRVTMLGMENYAISARTKNPELSWKLMEFLLREETQVKMAERMEKQPSLIEAGSKFAEMDTGYNRHVMTDAVKYGRVPDNIEKYNEVWTVLQKKLDLIWIGREQVRPAMEEAVSRINPILKGETK